MVTECICLIEKILGVKKNEVKNVEKLFEEVKELVRLTIIHSGAEGFNRECTGGN